MKAYKTGLLLLIVIALSLGLLAIGYGVWAGTASVTGTVNTGNFNANFGAAWSNDPPGTIDPGKTKDVGWTTTALGSSQPGGLIDLVLVTIGNAYPGYQVDVYATIQDNGTVHEQIGSPEIATSSVLLSVTDISNPPIAGVTTLQPGQQVTSTFRVNTLQEVGQLKLEPGHTYYSTIDISVSMNGTPAVPGLSLWGGVACALLFFALVVWLIRRRLIPRDIASHTT